MTTLTTTQGDMWDRISKEQYSTEYSMRDILQVNHNYADALTLPSEITLTLPDIETSTAVSTPPPWEM